MNDPLCECEHLVEEHVDELRCRICSCAGFRVQPPDPPRCPEPNDDQRITVEVPSAALQDLMSAVDVLEHWGKTCSLVIVLGRDGKLKTIAIDTE